MKKFITKTIHFLLIILTSLLILDVFAQVVFRYVLAKSLDWSEEVARYMIVYITFLGSAQLIGEKGHIAVDFVLQKFPLKTQKYVHLLITLLMLSACMILLVFGAKFAYLSRTGFTTATQISFVWIYMVLPIMGFISSFYLVTDIFNQIRRWKEQEVNT